MNKSILVLDENSLVHGLVASALDLDGLTLHHEFNPSRFVERAQETDPDLILLSNSDHKTDYAVCRALKGDAAFSAVPLVLMVNSNESINADTLARLQVEGVIRKPFEASDLQQQVSKHLDMIDLVGSAYEYRKSQSLREEDANPLAGIDVLDSEVLGMLQDAGPHAATATPVPEVDFSRELAAEDETAPPLDMAAGALDLDEPTEAILDEEPEPLLMDSDQLAEELQPENAFEAIDAPATGLSLPEEQALDELSGVDFGEDEALEEPSDMDFEEDGPLDELDAGDVLGEETPGEFTMPTAFDQPLDSDGPDSAFTSDEFPPEPPDMPDFGGDAETIIELTSDDLLEEEAPGESAAPSDFDQPLHADAATAAPQTLDDVDVELAEADIDFPSVEGNLDDGDVDPFEAQLDDLPPPLDDDSDIPPTVRRMMELKPVFSMSYGEREQQLDDGSAPADGMGTTEPSDEELDRMAAELGNDSGLPDVPEDAVLDEDFGTAEPAESLAVVEHDGVDEARVSQAMADDEAAGLGVGEFSEALEDDGLTLDDDMDTASLAAVQAAAGDSPLALDDDDSIAIDLDEESLIMSSLDEEDISDATFVFGDAANEGDLDEVAGGGREGDSLESELLPDELDVDGDPTGIESFREFPQMEDAEPLEVDIRAAAPQPQGPSETFFKDAPEDLLAVDDAFTKAYGSSDALGAEEETPEFARDEGFGTEDEPVAFGGDDGLTIDDDQLGPGETLTLDEDITEATLSLEDEQLLSLEQETLDELQDLEASLDDIPDTPAATFSKAEDAAVGDMGEELLQDDLTPLEDEESLFGDESAATPAEQEWPAAEALDAAGEGDDFADDLFRTDDGEATEELFLDEEITEARLSPEDDLLLGAEAGEPTEELLMDEEITEARLSPEDEQLLGAEASTVGSEYSEEQEEDDDDTSFEDDFAALRAEIEANPEGEKLSDILRQEGISESVESIEFELPEEEGHPRVMGFEDIPDDDAMAESEGADPLAAAFTDEVLAAGDSQVGGFSMGALHGLDDQLRARLSDVLDEVITTSVRKAVKEEMPRLIDQMEKEQNLP